MSLRRKIAKLLSIEFLLETDFEKIMEYASEIANEYPGVAGELPMRYRVAATSLKNDGLICKPVAVRHRQTGRHGIAVQGAVRYPSFSSQKPVMPRLITVG